MGNGRQGPHGRDPVASTAESGAAQEKRRRQRLLFDAVADLYETSRPEYAEELVDYVVQTSGVDETSRVLEVGCGTGKFTRQLAARGVQLTAIDISDSMIVAARRAPTCSSVDFRCTSFEDLDAANGSFDLVVAAEALHWVDPEVRFTRSARILRPGGWLAVVWIEQRYDEPFGAAIRAMWTARSGETGWTARRGPVSPEAIAGSGGFETPVEASFTRRVHLPTASVLDLEQTRATWLSWTEEDRVAALAQLRRHLTSGTIGLTEVSTVTMARVASRR